MVMRRNWVLDHLGLARPYRFERTILGAFALLLLAATITAAGVMHVGGELAFHTPLAAYFGYLTVLAVGAIVLLRWPRLAAVALILCVVDLSLGVGSFVLKAVGQGTLSLLPQNVSDPERFAWHPLLQAVPIPSLSLTTSNGVVIHHTSEGTRGREPSPEEIATHAIVATFGGSSTYDIALSEGETWSDRLEQVLGRDRFLVVNQGVPGYTTVETLIQTEFYEARFGKMPRCAVYYVGWNDLRNTRIDHLDPAFADFHLPSQVDSLLTRRIGGAHLTISPLLTLAARVLSALVDTVQYSSSLSGKVTADPDPALESDFERNIRSISAINRARGVRTIWVPQMLNRARLADAGQYGWLPYVRDKDVWPLEQRLNTIVADTARALSDPFVDLRIDDFVADDFVDQGHFSKAGAAKFAAFVAPVVAAACR